MLLQCLNLLPKLLGMGFFKRETPQQSWPQPRPPGPSSPREPEPKTWENKQKTGRIHHIYEITFLYFIIYYKHPFLVGCLKGLALYKPRESIKCQDYNYSSMKWCHGFSNLFFDRILSFSLPFLWFSRFSRTFSWFFYCRYVHQTLDVLGGKGRACQIIHQHTHETVGLSHSLWRLLGCLTGNWSHRDISSPFTHRSSKLPYHSEIRW